jgi:beta-glucosidase
MLKAEKQLKAFNKVFVGSGKETVVSVNININDLAYFDEKTSKWVVEPGTYKLIAGSSSKDLRQSVLFTVNKN